MELSKNSFCHTNQKFKRKLTLEEVCITPCIYYTNYIKNISFKRKSKSQENIDDLERAQKTFAKLVLKEKYTTYEESLIKLNVDSLSQRRQILCLKFAKDGIKHDKLSDLLPMRTKEHDMQIRQSEKFKVDFANTERLRNGSIITMQNYLNEDNMQNIKRNYG